MKRDTTIDQTRETGQSESSDLPTLDPAPEPYGRPTGAAGDASWMRRRRSLSLTRLRRNRFLRSVAVVITAGILGAAAAHGIDQLSRPSTPKWARACSAAIAATARLRKSQGTEIDQAMQATWAAVAGIPVRPRSTTGSDVVRLQRLADDAMQSCLAPATAQP
jgi:hypothetical protein